MKSIEGKSLEELRGTGEIIFSPTQFKCPSYRSSKL